MTRSLADRVLWLAVAAAAAGTAVAWLGGLGWLFALAEHFHLHLLVLGAACLPLALWRGRRRAAALAASLVVANALGLAPAWSMAAAQAPAAPDGRGPELTVLHLNVRMGNRDHDALVALALRVQPDLIALSEVDTTWTRALDGPLASWPHRALAPRGDFFGLALYSRHPLADARVELPAHGGLPWIRAEVDVAGRTWQVAALHTLPPIGRGWVDASQALLDDIVAARGDLARRAVVCGDFNLTPWSASFQRFVDASGLRLATSAAAPSWPAAFPPLRLPIDHCLASDDVRVHAQALGPDVGSDHLPLLLTVSAGPGEG